MSPYRAESLSLHWCEEVWNYRLTQNSRFWANSSPEAKRSEPIPSFPLATQLCMVPTASQEEAELWLWLGSAAAWRNRAEGGQRLDGVISGWTKLTAVQGRLGSQSHLSQAERLGGKRPGAVYEARDRQNVWHTGRVDVFPGLAQWVHEGKTRDLWGQKFVFHKCVQIVSVKLDTEQIFRIRNWTINFLKSCQIPQISKKPEKQINILLSTNHLPVIFLFSLTFWTAHTSTASPFDNFITSLFMGEDKINTFSPLAGATKIWF